VKLVVEETHVAHEHGRIPALHRVLDARQVGGRILVLYDYMAFPRGYPSRNLYAHDLSGELLWRADDIGAGAVDGYTNFISEEPLVVGNFAGYDVTIDPETGRVLERVFTK
jgi:hypothetical protein